jgi:DNA-directed RNA polymerase subunit RPC12/RpoP
MAGPLRADFEIAAFCGGCDFPLFKKPVTDSLTETQTVECPSCQKKNFVSRVHIVHKDEPEEKAEA